MRFWNTSFFLHMVLHFTDYPSIGIDILNFDNVCWLRKMKLERFECAFLSTYLINQMVCTNIARSEYVATEM